MPDWLAAELAEYDDQREWEWVNDMNYYYAQSDVEDGDGYPSIIVVPTYDDVPSVMRVEWTLGWYEQEGDAKPGELAKLLGAMDAASEALSRALDGGG